MASRSASWMDEVGHTRPRRPSATGTTPYSSVQAQNYRPHANYQYTHNSGPGSHRSQSFGGPAQSQRPFSLAVGSPSIAEDAIGEGSDSGSDIARYAGTHRFSTRASSFNGSQDPWLPMDRNQWKKGLHISLPPPNYLLETDGSPVLHTPLSPTGVTEMRQLTAAIANASLLTPRDMSSGFDIQQRSPTSPYASHSPFLESHYTNGRQRPPSGEYNGNSRERHGGSRLQPDWQGLAQSEPILYAVVAFKLNRADVYYFHRSGGMNITSSSVVIVDADRGQDLGTVVCVTGSPIEAHDMKRKLNRQHYEVLLQQSRTARPPGWSTENSFNTYHDFNANCAYAGGFHLGDGNSSVRKAIKRLAFDREIQLLDQKRELEERAKRLCILAVQRHGLHLHEMEILDAEFQHDFNKLTFYFLSPQYLHFNPLVTELFKLFKTRIWMSALNPASCVAPTSAPLQQQQLQNHNNSSIMNGNNNNNNIPRNGSAMATTSPLVTAPAMPYWATDQFSQQFSQQFSTGLGRMGIGTGGMSVSMSSMPRMRGQGNELGLNPNPVSTLDLQV